MREIVFVRVISLEQFWGKMYLIFWYLKNINCVFIQGLKQKSTLTENVFLAKPHSTAIPVTHTV